MVDPIKISEVFLLLAITLKRTVNDLNKQNKAFAKNTVQFVQHVHRSFRGKGAAKINHTKNAEVVSTSSTWGSR